MSDNQTPQSKDKNTNKLPIQKPQFGNPRMPNMGIHNKGGKPNGNFVKPTLVKRAAKGR